MSKELDARGLKCPLPVLKARKALQGAAPGEILTVLADDPGAPGDFQHFAEAADLLLSEEKEGEFFRFTLQMKASAK